ncbi:hydrogenase expression/formation C-terminal domain-containing protein [Shigella boydii]
MQPHSINLTQLPISEVIWLFLYVSWAGKYSDSYHWLWRQAISTPRYLRHVWHFTLYGHLKSSPVTGSYEICRIPEVVLAAPEDLVDSCAAA